jgi:hypothetical protein
MMITIMIVASKRPIATKSHNDSANHLESRVGMSEVNGNF